jgi:hypothetical protein
MPMPPSSPHASAWRARRWAAPSPRCSFRTWPQLIAHTSQRLRHCADRLARDALGDDDEDGAALVEPAAQGPNPVTQDEMHAGSIELF